MPITRSEKKRNDSPAPNKGIRHINTPKKARIRAIIEDFKRGGPTLLYRYKADIFNYYRVLKDTRYRILKGESDRTGPAEETRGRYPIITIDLLRKYEEIITNYGYEGRELI